MVSTYPAQFHWQWVLCAMAQSRCILALPQSVLGWFSAKQISVMALPLLKPICIRKMSCSSLQFSCWGAKGAPILFSDLSFVCFMFVYNTYIFLRYNYMLNINVWWANIYMWVLLLASSLSMRGASLAPHDFFNSKYLSSSNVIYIVTQEVTSCRYFIHEAGIVTISQSTQ